MPLLAIQELNETVIWRALWGPFHREVTPLVVFHRYCRKVQRSELRAVQSPRDSELAHPFPLENTPVTGRCPVQQWDSAYLPEGKALPAETLHESEPGWEGGGNMSMAEKADFCKEIPAWSSGMLGLDSWVQTRGLPVTVAKASHLKIYVQVQQQRSGCPMR